MSHSHAAPRAGRTRPPLRGASRPPAPATPRPAPPVPPVEHRPIEDPEGAGAFAGWRLVWLVVTALALLVLGLDRWGSALPWQIPSLARDGAVVTVATAYALGLGVRTGDRPVLMAALVGVGTAAGLWSGVGWIIAGVAVALTVVSSVFAVLVTRPAVGMPRVVGEVLIATLVASGGALAIGALDPSMTRNRYSYLALAFALIWIIALVNGLGAGLHGLGKRGVAMIVVGTLMLGVALAYGEAIQRWGSPGLVLSIETMRTQAREALGAVPHPLAALLGIPALVWGVFMRARRRQGWWACAFGVAATVATSAMFVSDLSLTRQLLSLLYTLVVGLLLGFLVVRGDLFFTGSRGARARRDEEQSAARPEPGRTASLR